MGWLSELWAEWNIVKKRNLLVWGAIWACLNPCKTCVESHFVCRLDDDLALVAQVAQNQTLASSLNCRLNRTIILPGSSIFMKLCLGLERSKPHSQSSHRAFRMHLKPNATHKRCESLGHSPFLTFLGIILYFVWKASENIMFQTLNHGHIRTSWAYGVASPAPCLADVSMSYTAQIVSIRHATWNKGLFWILADASHGSMLSKDW